MILWLASYPRSGNTLLRLILKGAFARDTYSKHDDAADIGADAVVAAEVGHRFLGDSWPAAYDRMRAADELYLVKTHDPPEDAGRAVYVVRDGRAACRSFHQYLRDFPGHAGETTAADVVAGFTPFGSWGEHLDRWNPLARPDTLLLRYEDLVADSRPQIERLAAFAGLSQAANWHNDFDRLHAMSPRFFRAGAAADPAAALSPADAALFWAEHGDWMRRLGYGAGDARVDPAARRRLLADRGRLFNALRARAATAARDLGDHRAAVAVQQAHADGRLTEGRALFAEQVTVAKAAVAEVSRLTAESAALRARLRVARRDRAEQRREAGRRADELAGAVAELHGRLRLLLTSRFLRLGWGLGFGRTPYWADADRDELAPLLARLRPTPPSPQQLPRSAADARPLPDGPLPSVSVVICTRNPRLDIFARVLDAIDAQTVADVDLVIIDNGSTSPVTLPPGRRVTPRVIVAPVPGLSAARCAGIAAATGELLVFVDDDNFLAPDYLELAKRIAVVEPRVGLFGGIAQVELERPIPGWKRPVLPYLGVRDHGPAPITAFADHWGEWEPIGAGMVARREVAERFVRMYRASADARRLGRSGTALLSGEDTLFARAAHRCGYACSYQPDLVLTHYMKASRLRVRYLARLLAGHGRSYVLLHRTLGQPVDDLKFRTAVARLLYRVRTAGRAGLVTWFWDLGYAAERRRDRAR